MDGNNQARTTKLKFAIFYLIHWRKQYLKAASKVGVITISFVFYRKSLLLGGGRLNIMTQNSAFSRDRNT